jgi:hypothetical protein
MDVRYALALALSLATLGADQARGVRTRDALALARQYLDTWQLELAAVVAEEHYEQVRSVWSGTMNNRYWRHVETRTTRSDVLLLRAPAQDAWLSFRDVFEVDGRAVRDREQRFDELFRAPTAHLATDASRIANESARFNLGRVTRNINSPTAALIFLQSPYVESIKWSFDSNATRNDRRVWVLRFAQDRPPYAVRETEGRPVRADGRMWIEPGSGRILETELNLRARDLTSRVDTQYGPMSGAAVFVPIRMDDAYEMPSRERVSGVATYTNHRLFRTGARIVGDGGNGNRDDGGNGFTQRPGESEKS